MQQYYEPTAIYVRNPNPQHYTNTTGTKPNE